MNDTEGLTQEEDQILCQFKEITDYDSTNDDEHAKVLRLLTVCNWNLETAIARFFDNDFPHLFDDHLLDTSGHINEPISTNFEEIATRLNDPPINLMSTPFSNDILLPRLPRALPITNKWKFQAGLISKNQPRFQYHGIISPIIFILMIIPNILIFLGYGLNKLFGNFAPNLFRILGLREDEDDLPVAPLYTSSEEIENYNVGKLVLTADEKPSLPVWKGEFNAAFEEAKINYKWLCVILFNSESSSAEKLLDFVKSENFRSFVEKNDIILYLGDVSYPEPLEVGKLYQAFGLPYLALISNISVDGLSAPEFAIACKYLHFTRHDTDRIIKRLNHIVSKYEPQLVSQRFDKQERDLAKLIREEQDNAYQESLLKDMERENQKQRKLEEKRKAQEALEAEIERKRVFETKRKEKIIRYINDSYTRDDNVWSKGEYTTIQFRTEDGQRFIRKFHQDETVNDIYNFVASKNLIEELLKDEDNDDVQNVLTKLRKYEYEFEIEDDLIKFEFELISAMPRLKLQPSTKLIKDLKEIWPNGSLLIEKAYEEEYDVDEDDVDTDHSL
ncbi:hypothetical protein CANINC_001456 [Pichia inconspicua]|uniref:UBX domain-containing protein n=1 Tax=Pichia inconspicua TaxID=52247 RepID=A0A4T0X3Y1_9ASCO|nr:hypothetical protein CANINC_001456 [[Candida] inconspicua]